MLPYDFNAMRLGLSGGNPQLSNMGMIEFHINGLIPGGKEALILGLSSYTMPTPRKVNQESVDYINGVINYPSRPNAIGLLSLEFNDFIDGRQREVLHKWFDLVYDERTGLGLPPSQVKTNAHMVLFGPNAITSVSYFLKGIFPMGDPDIPSIDYGQGSIVKIKMDFSVDFVFEELGNLAQTASGALGIAQGVSTLTT